MKKLLSCLIAWLVRGGAARGKFFLKERRTLLLLLLSVA